jgi:DNA recombination protein RmuC
MQASFLPILMLLLGLILGGALGGCLVWLYAKAERAKLEAMSEADEEKIQWIASAQQNLRETFALLAAKSLRQNARDFAGRVSENLVAHAQQIDTLKSSLEKQVNRNLSSHATQIGTLKSALENRVSQNLTSHAQQIGLMKSTLEKNITQLDSQIRDLDRKREGAYQSLKDQVLQLERAHSSLLHTTQQLLAALKSGPVRGRWGEIQLRKIVELAGMNEHVSFMEQTQGLTGGKADTVIHLPNDGHIPLDSKIPLQSFLEAIEAVDERARNAKMDEHVKTLKDKIRELSRRNYWKEYDPSPELTIMFIPIESSLMAAYERDPEIIEFALSQKIILASPITLLGFMKSIAYGWQQFTINKNARQILAQGKDLYSRIQTWMDHYRRTGERITALANSYNESVGSLQSRFLPACRRFQELTAIPEELKDTDAITVGVSLPTAVTNLQGSSRTQSDELSPDGQPSLFPTGQ